MVTSFWASSSAGCAHFVAGPSRARNEASSMNFCIFASLNVMLGESPEMSLNCCNRTTAMASGDTTCVVRLASFLRLRVILWVPTIAALSSSPLLRSRRSMCFIKYGGALISCNSQSLSGSLCSLSDTMRNFLSNRRSRFLSFHSEDAIMLAITATIITIDITKYTANRTLWISGSPPNARLQNDEAAVCCSKFLMGIL